MGTARNQAHSRTLFRKSQRRIEDLLGQWTAMALTGGQSVIVDAVVARPKQPRLIAAVATETRAMGGGRQ